MNHLFIKKTKKKCVLIIHLLLLKKYIYELSVTTNLTDLASITHQKEVAKKVLKSVTLNRLKAYFENKSLLLDKNNKVRRMKLIFTAESPQFTNTIYLLLSALVILR
jgi:hypothetical protein